jgi:hypothetical protein
VSAAFFAAICAVSALSFASSSALCCSLSSNEVRLLRLKAGA